MLFQWIASFDRCKSKLCRPSSLAAGVGILILCVTSLLASDSRVTISTETPTFNGSPLNFYAGGRVGNWIQDPSGNQEIVFDATPRSPTNARAHRTDIYSLSPVTYAVTLISSTSWLSGDSTPPPREGVYVGNPWLCPTSGSVSDTYMLFQAQSNASMLGAPAQPGAGFDNNVWLYVPSSQTIWRLTNFPVSDSPGVLQQGVLGAQCSQDSDSNTHTLHIVFEHIIQGPPSPAQSIPAGLNCEYNPPNGTCWSYGHTELIYADVNLDPTGTPVVDVDSPPEMGYLSNSSIVRVNPLNVVGMPVDDVTGSGTINPSTHILTPAGNPVLTDGMVNAGIHLTTATLDYYTNITASNPGPPGTLTLNNIPDESSVRFEIQNYGFLEPNWYVTNLGDLYFTASQQPIFHSAIGLLWNQSTQVFTDLTPGSPSPLDGAANQYVNTWFNEFPTPSPGYGHMMFMSDRGTAPSHYGLVPEYSDHYLCSTPACVNVVRLTYYNDNGADAEVLGCTKVSGCSPVTATRGAWSPDGSMYISLVEFTTGLTNKNSRAIMALYRLRFPNTEVSGTVSLSGAVAVGR